MESHVRVSHIFLLSLILFVSTSDGRKDLGKYWGEMMKDQPMPEAIERLLSLGPVEIVEVKEHESTGDRLFADEFEPRPNVSVYHDDVSPNQLKSTKEDCNTHVDGAKSKKSYKDDFEPIPNVSVYSD